MTQEDYKLSKQVQYWAGMLIDHDHNYKIAEEIVEAINYSEALIGNNYIHVDEVNRILNQFIKENERLH